MGESDQEELLEKQNKPTSKDGEALEILLSRITLLLRQNFLAILWVFINTAAVVGVVFLNKHILSTGFQYGVFVTMIHLWVTSAYMFCYVHSGYIKITPIAYFQVVPLSASNTWSIIFGNLSLQYNKVAVFQVFKVLITPTVAILQRLFMASSITQHVGIGIVLVIFGGLISINITGGFGVNFIGLVLGAAGTLCSSTYTVVSAVKLKSLKIDAMAMTYYQMPFMAFSTFLCALFFEYEAFQKFGYAWNYNFKIVLLVFASSLFAPFINISTLQVIKHTSPLTYAITSNLKSSVIFFIALLFTADAANFQTVVGLLILHVGIGYYVWAKTKETAAAKAAAVATAAASAAAAEPEPVQVLPQPQVNTPPPAPDKLDSTWFTLYGILMAVPLLFVISSVITGQ